MPKYPYFLVGYNSVTANATEAITWNTGSNEEITIYKIRFHSTGGFDLIDIEDQAGTPYTNADSNNPLDSNLLTASSKNEYYEIVLPEPLVLPPSTQITFSVSDTSGSTNEVWIVGIGTREIK